MVLGSITITVGQQATKTWHQDNSITVTPDTVTQGSNTQFKITIIAKYSDGTGATDASGTVSIPINGNILQINIEPNSQISIPSSGILELLLQSDIFKLTQTKQITITLKLTSPQVSTPLEKSTTMTVQVPTGGGADLTNMITSILPLLAITPLFGMIGKVIKKE